MKNTYYRYNILSARDVLTAVIERRAFLAPSRQIKFVQKNMRYELLRLQNENPCFIQRECNSCRQEFSFYLSNP